jgi:hypothetical protein
LKAVITKHSRGPFHIVHFSVELPLLVMGNPGIWLRNRELLGRACDLDSMATDMADFNVGRFHREIIDAKEIYHDYLNDLFTLSGLEYIHRSGRYQIELLAGLCFDAAAVCQNVARVVHRHFYSNANLQMDCRLWQDTTSQGDAHVQV